MLVFSAFLHVADTEKDAQIQADMEDAVETEKKDEALELLMEKYSRRVSKVSNEKE